MGIIFTSVSPMIFCTFIFTFSLNMKTYPYFSQTENLHMKLTTQTTSIDLPYIIWHMTSNKRYFSIKQNILKC